MVFLIGIIFCALVAIQWHIKGRSFVGGFILSAILTPIVGCIVGCCLENRVKKAV